MITIMWTWMIIAVVITCGDSDSGSGSGADQATYECTFVTGSGTGGAFTEVGGQQGSECAEACIYLKKTKDSTINGVTFSTGFRTGCWCQRLMTTINTAYTYNKACFIKPKALGVTTCEGKSSTITCPADKVIKIARAMYGRLNKQVCVHSAMSNTNCRSSSSLSKVTEACDGQNSCEVSATEGVFGDPCGGTYKYLDIKYICVATYTEAKDGACASVSEEQCRVISTQKGVYFYLFANRMDLPAGCYQTKSSGYIFYNAGQSSERCSNERVCLCQKVTYTEAKDGTCTSVSEEQCRVISTRKGVYLYLFDNRMDRPAGCYQAKSSGYIFYNAGQSSKRCSNERVCFCQKAQ